MRINEKRNMNLHMKHKVFYLTTAQHGVWTSIKHTHTHTHNYSERAKATISNNE